MSTSGGFRLLEASAHLTGAEIATLFTAPTEIVAAPVSGIAWLVVAVNAQFEPGVVSYQSADDGPGLYFSGADPGAATQAGSNFPGSLIDNPTADRIATTTGTSFSHLDPAVAGRAIDVGTPQGDPTINAPVVTTTLDDGGLGYVVNDTGTIDGNGYGAPAEYKVLSVAAITGAVLTYSITAAGDGYNAVGNPHTTTAAGGQPGIGTGLQLNVTAVTPPDGDLYVGVLYYPVPVH